MCLQTAGETNTRMSTWPINGLQGQTRELKMELLEACRGDLQDLGIAVADVAPLIRGSTKQAPSGRAPGPPRPGLGR